MWNLQSGISSAMRKTVTISILLFSFAAVVVVRAQANGATARAAIEPVIETAKAWQADAVLTNVSAVGVAPDGTAETWDYLFYSSTARKYGRITARMAPGGGFIVKETSKGPRDAVPGDFVDSDRVVATARWNGLNLRAVILGLTNRGWAVYGGLKRGDSIVWIDGRTAAYIRTEAIPKK
jgi:hypothetical protein